MRPAKHRQVLWSLVFLNAIGASTFAQLPQTELTTISPTGGQAGQTIELRITGGQNLVEVDALQFSHPGMTAKRHNSAAAGATPVVFDVRIDETVPPGVYDVTCNGLWGISNPRRFHVSQFPDVSEATGNQSPESATSIPVNATIQGALPQPGEVDWYRLTTSAGQRLILNCWAARLDSQLSASVSVYDARTRRRLAYARRDAQSDPVLVFDVPKDGEYLIEVHDEQYRHGAEMHYRLEVHTGPYVEFADPAAGQAGTTSEITFYGYNLPGSEKSAQSRDGVPLEQVTRQVAFPTATDTLATGHCIRPLAAAMDLFDYRIESEQFVSNALPLGITTSTVVREQEPNETSATAQRLTIGQEVSAHFAQHHDHDVFRFEAPAKSTIALDVIAERGGTLADPVMRVSRVLNPGAPDEKIEEIRRVDDETRVLDQILFPTQTVDPSYRFQVPEARTYQVELHDLYAPSRGGYELGYRLSVRYPEPDFRIVAVPLAMTPGGIAPLAVRRGDSLALKLFLFRQDGFIGRVTVRADQLPDGVTCAPIHFNELTEAVTTLIVTTPDAQAGSFPLKLVATGVVDPPSDAADAQPIERTHSVRLGTVVWGAGQNDPADCRLTNASQMTVLEESAPFQVTTAAMELDAYQGTQCALPLQLTRRNSFAGGVEWTPQLIPRSMKIEPVKQTFAADQTAAVVHLRLEEKLKPGSYFIWAHAKATVPYRRNPAAVARAESALEIANAAVMSARQADALAKEQLATATQAAAKAAQALAAITSQVAMLESQIKAQSEPTAAATQPAESPAEAQREEQQTDRQQLETALEAARSQLKPAQATVETTLRQQQQAQASADQAMQKLQQATQAQSAAQQQLEQARKAAEPRNLTVIKPCTPIQLNVLESPFHISTDPPDGLVVAPGEEKAIRVRLNRLNQYQGGAKLTLVSTTPDSFVTATETSLPPGESVAAITITVAKTAPPGSVIPIRLRAASDPGDDRTIELPLTVTVKK